MSERVSSDVTVAQLVDAYGDAVSAAALARGTSRYDDAVANAAGARSALIADIERLLRQRDQLLEALRNALPVLEFEVETRENMAAILRRSHGRPQRVRDPKG